MPFSERLKRLARSLRLSSQRTEPKVPVLSGWNGLPEDVLGLLLTEYLGVTNPSAHTLSMTCRAYASTLRPHLLYTVRIPRDSTSHSHPSRIMRLTRDLRSNPRLRERIGALRVINDRADDPVVGNMFQIPGKRGNPPSLTGLGRSLVRILTRYHFPSLHTFELPLLKWDQQWSSLALPLRAAILAFIQRHNGVLKELSITMQYPLELGRFCSLGLTKLEYRIEGLSSKLDPFTFDLKRQSNVPGVRPFGDDPRPIVLEELSVMHSIWGEDSELAKQLRRGSGSLGNIETPYILNLKRLKRLTYYSSAAGSELPLVLNHCAHTHKYLGLYMYVWCHTSSLDLPALRNLEHLTLSINRWNDTYCAALPWISSTVKYFFDTTETRAPLLKTLKIVTRTLGHTAEEGIWEMEGFMSSTLESLQRAAASAPRSHGTHSAANSGSRASGWSLKDFSVVVFHDRTEYYDHQKRVGSPEGLDETLLAQGLKTRLVAGFSKFDPSVTVGVEIRRDRFSMWLLA